MKIVQIYKAATNNPTRNKDPDKALAPTEAALLGVGVVVTAVPVAVPVLVTTAVEVLAEEVVEVEAVAKAAAICKGRSKS